MALSHYPKLLALNHESLALDPTPYSLNPRILALSHESLALDPTPYTLAQVEASGGVVNVNTVAQKMEELQQDSNVFQIPPWMAYILRTFTVLEGVGLAQDENYSITSECYPFLAKRLFTDDSPRAQQALRQMLYGSGATASSKLDVERLLDLGKGFQDYTASTSAVESTQGLENAAGQVNRTPTTLNTQL